AIHLLFSCAAVLLDLPPFPTRRSSDLLAQQGIENAVATLGTATTPEHVQKLLRVSDKVVFSFDGDKAGRRAAWRALQVCLPLLRSEEHTSELQSRENLVCHLLLEKKNK